MADMRAVAEQDWQGGTPDAGGTSLTPAIDRARVAAALSQAATDLSEAGAEMRPALLRRAWMLAETLPRPVTFLVIGASGAARDAMRFLAGLDAPIPDDLAAVVACIRVVHGDRPGLVATGGSGIDMRVPDEPIMLTPHAPVTLTYRAACKALQTLQFTYLRNLTAGSDDEVIEDQLARADRVIWLTDAAAPWDIREEALFHALPSHLSEDAVLVLTEADKVTGDAELQAGFDAKVQLLKQRFAALVPIALPEALQATPGGTLADAALFSASGGHALLGAVRQAQTRARQGKDDEATQTLNALLTALRQAHDTEAEAQRQQAEAEARAAADQAEAEAEARAKAEAEAAPAPAPAPVPSYPRPDETALAILREEAERETAARREDVARLLDPAPSDDATEGPESIAGFLRSCAAARADTVFDPEDEAARRDAFDDFLHLVSGLSQRLREAEDATLADRDLLLEDLEEAEDMIMLLSFEGDIAALDEVADLVSQLVGDLFDRLEEISSA